MTVNSCQLLRRNQLCLQILFLSALWIGLSAAFSLLPSLPTAQSCRRRRRCHNHFLSASSGGNFDYGDENDDSDGNSNTDSFMASLRNRMLQVTDRDTKIPLVVLDAMLPRQVLKIHVQNDLFLQLIKSRLEDETPCFGMLGMAKLASGEKVHLTVGVEVHIVGKPRFLTNDENQPAGILLELKAGRRFALQGEIATATATSSAGSSQHGWTEGRVRFLSTTTEQEAEAEIDNNSRSSRQRMSLVRAMQMTREFTSTNPNTKTSSSEGTNMSLVDRWIQLARERERQPGQIDQLLQDLGSIPPVEEPSERAFWVGALINPIPAMGVAREIRPALLSAKTAEERTQVALDGIIQSIKHMNESDPLQ